MALTFHREALEGCGAAAKSASGAFSGLVGAAVPGAAAFGAVSGSEALATATAGLRGAAEQASRTLGSRLEAMDRTLDAIDRTYTAADAQAVRR
ncbi:hypothetical protein AB0K18_40755 [Nonomuraea sp. NPDC049421]|uniref:hypothetical protein n=1 Tax=Nonomuraea sp. NPDC049421 TaxID=3155275 RepID=UPI003446A98D